MDWNEQSQRFLPIAATGIQERHPALATKPARSPCRFAAGPRGEPEVTRGERIRESSRIAALLLIGLGLWRMFATPMIAKIVVSKSERRLTALGPDGGIVASFPVIVGRSPLGTKEREGDRRTPEGEYYVCFKNPKSQFHRSLGLSYPNTADAARGLAQGAITPAEYDQIVAADRARRIPPWKTALGGEIFIHGEMEGRDGTAGCVAIRNEDMERLFPEVALGTPVVIEP
jgi:lipoprotein-anchoring transpeptidase ErfK/SrfK